MPEVTFNGPDGRIEGKFHKSEIKNAPGALILHPHPLYGGTMNNKVVYSLYQAFKQNGFHVLRINFRGVGRSQGKFDNGVGELTDAATALDWLQNQNPDISNFWISGFSFGAWIALQLMMRRPEIQSFAVASPPVNKYDFSFLSPCPAKGIIAQGDQDSIVSEAAVADFVDRLSKQKNTDVDYQVIHGADHFFRGKTDELTEIVGSYITHTMLNRQPRKSKPDRRRRQNIE
ncbi:MAG: alpha/beta hydrolase [Pseudomonadota bacterium]